MTSEWNSPVRINSKHQTPGFLPSEVTKRTCHASVSAGTFLDTCHSPKWLPYFQGCHPHGSSKRFLGMFFLMMSSNNKKTEKHNSSWNLHDQPGVISKTHFPYYQDIKQGALPNKNMSIEKFQQKNKQRKKNTDPPSVTSRCVPHG